MSDGLTNELAALTLSTRSSDTTSIDVAVKAVSGIASDAVTEEHLENLCNSLDGLRGSAADFAVHPALPQFAQELPENAAFETVVLAINSLVNDDIVEARTRAQAFVDANAQLHAERADLTDKLVTGVTAFKNIEARCKRLGEKLHKAKQKIHDLEMNNNNPSPAGAGGSGHKSVSRLTKDPEPFTAEIADHVKRAEAFKAWRTRLRLCWLDDDHIFTTERKKLTHIARCLSGKPLLAINSQIEVIAENKDPAKWAWKTANELLKHLADKYDNFDLKMAAHRELELLSMTKNMCWADFEEKLVSLLDRCNDIPDHMKVMLLRQKVTSALRDGIAGQLNQPEAHEFTKWLEMHRKLAVNYEERDWRNKSYNSYTVNSVEAITFFGVSV